MDLTRRRDRKYEGHCTWEGCQAEGSNRIEDSHGTIWAYLCGEHVAQYAQAMKAAHVPTIVQYWILAQGGKAATAKRLMEQQREALGKGIIREDGRLGS